MGKSYPPGSIRYSKEGHGFSCICDLHEDGVMHKDEKALCHVVPRKSIMLKQTLVVSI